jgi:hypothetical protein
MTDTDETETEPTVRERGSGTPMPVRRNLPPTKGIEVRDSGPGIMRGIGSETKLHGPLSDGDPERTSLVFERVGESGVNAGRTLMSDRADARNTIEGGESAYDIGVRSRSKIHAGAYERTPEVIEAEAARRGDVSFADRVAQARRIKALRGSMVSEEGDSTPNAQRRS